MAASMPREEIWNSPWALCLHTDQTQRCKPEQFVDDIIQCKTPWYSSLKGSLQTEHYIYLLRLCNINVLKDKTVNKHQDRKRLCRTAPIWSFQPCTYFKSLLLPFYQNSSSWNHSAPSEGGTSIASMCGDLNYSSSCSTLTFISEGDPGDPTHVKSLMW